MNTDKNNWEKGTLTQYKRTERHRQKQEEKEENKKAQWYKELNELINMNEDGTGDLCSDMINLAGTLKSQIGFWESSITRENVPEMFNLIDTIMKFEDLFKDGEGLAYKYDFDIDPLMTMNNAIGNIQEAVNNAMKIDLEKISGLTKDKVTITKVNDEMLSIKTLTEVIAENLASNKLTRESSLDSQGISDSDDERSDEGKSNNPRL